MRLGLPPFLGTFIAVAAHGLGWIDGADLAIALFSMLPPVIVLWLLLYRCPNCEDVHSTTDGDGWILDPEECRICGVTLRAPRR